MERRPIGETLLDPESQYLARSRYHARLEPYLARFPRGRIFICAQEDLSTNRRATLRALYRFAGVDDSFWSPEHDPRWNVARSERTSLDEPLRQRLAAELSDDAARLRELTGREFPDWRL